MSTYPFRLQGATHVRGNGALIQPESYSFCAPNNTGLQAAKCDWEQLGFVSVVTLLSPDIRIKVERNETPWVGFALTLH